MGYSQMSDDALLATIANRGISVEERITAQAEYNYRHPLHSHKPKKEKE